MVWEVGLREEDVLDLTAFSGVGGNDHVSPLFMLTVVFVVISRQNFNQAWY